MVRKPVALIFARLAFDDFELPLPRFFPVLNAGDAGVSKPASFDTFERARPAEVLTVIEIFMFVAVGGTWW